MNRPDCPFDAVLFDMDGTIVDTEPLWQESERLLMAEFGVEWTAADQAHSLGGSTGRVAHYMADLVAATGQPRPNTGEIARRFLDMMLAQLTTAPPDPQPGVIDLLHEVKQNGLTTALVSSSSRPLMTAILDSIGVEWFDVTISADDVERHKPDPLPYLTACAMIGVSPRTSIAIEDSPTGTEAATRAGAFVVAVQHMAPIEPHARRVVIDTLAGVDLAWLSRVYEPPD